MWVYWSVLHHLALGSSITKPSVESEMDIIVYVSAAALQLASAVIKSPLSRVRWMWGSWWVQCHFKWALKYSESSVESVVDPRVSGAAPPNVRLCSNKEPSVESEVDVGV